MYDNHNYWYVAEVDVQIVDIIKDGMVLRSNTKQLRDNLNIQAIDTNKLMQVIAQNDEHNYWYIVEWMFSGVDIDEGLVWMVFSLCVDNDNSIPCFLFRHFVTFGNSGYILVVGRIIIKVYAEF